MATEPGAKGSGPIQVIPSGLLGFFNLKNRGQNPAWMPDSVQPTLEMRDWYFFAAAQDYGSAPTVAVANAAVGFTSYAVPIVVPPSEAWYVTDYTVRTATLLAAEVFDAALAWCTPLSGVAQSRQFAVTEMISRTGPDKRWVSGCSGIWIPPSSEVGLIVCNAATAATITCTAYLRYARLPL